jgi:peroxiredoxin
MQTHSNPLREQRRAARRREKMSQNLLVIGGAILLLALMGTLLMPGKETKISGPARTGQPMPDFSLTDLDGNPVQISDFQGQPLLINAWATWCPPCRAEMPDLHAYYLNHREEGFVMLAVNAGETQSPVEEFIADMGFTFPVLLDPGKAALTQLGIHSFPTSIIVNRDGVIDQIHTGMLTAAMLDEKVTPLLAP